MTQPLHFPGCHPQSGAYHQQFFATLRQGKCPACYQPLSSPPQCRLYHLHTGWRASEQPTKYADQRAHDVTWQTAQERNES